MAYFNATYNWPSLNALTESGPFTGVIEEGRIVTKDPTTGVFELVGGGAIAGRIFQIAFYNSTDPDIAQVNGDNARWPNSLQVQNAAGSTGGNLATLSLPQDLEAQTDQYVGTPAVNAELTVYGVDAGDTDAADFGKLRVAAAGEPVVAKVVAAPAQLQEWTDPLAPTVTAITVRYGFNYAAA